MLNNGSAHLHPQVAGKFWLISSRNKLPIFPAYLMPKPLAWLTQKSQSLWENGNRQRNIQSQRTLLGKHLNPKKRDLYMGKSTNLQRPKQPYLHLIENCLPLPVLLKKVPGKYPQQEEQIDGLPLLPKKS